MSKTLTEAELWYVKNWEVGHEDGAVTISDFDNDPYEFSIIVIELNQVPWLIKELAEAYRGVVAKE